jgi:hypothetical protein
VTITLCVHEVLRDPALFMSDWRLAVAGVLLVSDEEFRIFQADQDEPVEQVSMRIDDPLAATKVREALPQPPTGKWWYFGRALVEAWTHHDSNEWVLHEVLSVWLEELGGDCPLCVKVRSQPWGWDQFL